MCLLSNLHDDHDDEDDDPGLTSSLTLCTTAASTETSGHVWCIKLGTASLYISSSMLTNLIQS